MRFMVDECVGPQVAKWLREQGFKVFSVYEEARGATDDDLIEKAYAKEWILITSDKVFISPIIFSASRFSSIFFFQNVIK